MKTHLINRKFLKASLVLFFLFLLQTGLTSATIQITIDVSPNVLNLQNQGEVVTVHTDIAYGLVVGSTVYLNDIPIKSWKSDDRGNFVAKFYMEDVKDLPLYIGEMNTLTMVGLTIDGTTFSGSQEIKVINVIPAGKK